MRLLLSIVPDDHSTIALELRQGDTVLIRNCPPISARKRFTLEKVLKSPETERDEMHARMAQAASSIAAQPSATMSAEQPAAAN